MSSCRSCGAPIIWAISPNGIKIPLDARAPTFVLDVSVPRTSDDGLPLARGGKRDDLGFRAYVSHFSTCPDAATHSKKKTEPQASLLPPEPPPGHWET